MLILRKLLLQFTESEFLLVQLLVYTHLQAKQSHTTRSLQNPSGNDSGW